MATFTIRAATEDDLPSLYRISLASHRAAYGSFIPPAEKPRFIKRYTDTPQHLARFIQKHGSRLQNPAWKYWVAVADDGSILGYTIAETISGDYVYKRGLFVDPERTNEGIGSALFVASIAQPKKGRIELTVIASNVRARRIYERHGFIATSDPVGTFYGAKQLVMRLEKD